ncbi:hypothetical protein ACSBR2_004454 [Camellia fascicularis]
MVPGIKMGRRKRATSACPQEIGTPLTFSDETQPPDDIQTVVEETQLGGNATPATNELGLQIRRLCPLQRILDRKAYLLYKDWRYNLKQEFLELEEKGVDDPYSHLPSGVSLEDWKYLIDVALKDESHLKHSKAGKANWGMLPYNHTSGSRSFPIAMSFMANEDGDIDFPEFYKKSHKSKKTRDWIDPKCGELHDDMVNLQVEATDAGLPLTHKELSRQVLGPKKKLLAWIWDRPTTLFHNL